jgi:signal transduction histidine kinase
MVFGIVDYTFKILKFKVSLENEIGSLFIKVKEVSAMFIPLTRIQGEAVL